jgi:hypothetical protein
MILLSSPPLARTFPSKDQANVLTDLLPFYNKSVSLETTLRLSPAEANIRRYAVNTVPLRQDVRERQLRLNHSVGRRERRAPEGERRLRRQHQRMQQPLTTHLCPRNFLNFCPVSTLHIRTLQSPLSPKSVFPLQEATSESSAEKLTPLTCELFFGFK